jgi:hypothetical protein
MRISIGEEKANLIHSFAFLFLLWARPDVHGRFFLYHEIENPPEQTTGELFRFRVCRRDCRRKDES